MLKVENHTPKCSPGTIRLGNLKVYGKYAETCKRLYRLEKSSGEQKLQGCIFVIDSRRGEARAVFLSLPTGHCNVISYSEKDLGDIQVTELNATLIIQYDLPTS